MINVQRLNNILIEVIATPLRQWNHQILIGLRSSIWISMKREVELVIQGHGRQKQKSQAVSRTT